jgi:hypothetical protein
MATEREFDIQLFWMRNLNILLLILHCNRIMDSRFDSKCANQNMTVRGSSTAPWPLPVPLGSNGIPMSPLHNLRLRLLVQQETEQIAATTSDDLDLSLVQARALCWLALLADAHEQQATDAEQGGDVEQAMGWFADAMRLRDVIHVVSSIEVPPAQDLEDGLLAA